jgi:hypothetical protein
LVLCRQAPGDSEQRARKIAEFLGATVAFTPVAAAAASSHAPPVGRCLVADVETLARAVEAGAVEASALQTILGRAERALIYGFRPTARHGRILQSLCPGGGLGLQPLEPPDTSFRVSGDRPEWCHQFSGVSLAVPNGNWDSAFIMRADSPSGSVLASAGTKPFFVRTDRGGTAVFLVACAELADLDEPIQAAPGLTAWFSRLAPLMMFLRGALGSRLWQGDRPRGCFIIDDLLLTRRYGFLEYGALLHTVRRLGLAVSIAFIPWNYSRSRTDVAAILSASEGAFSLCIHGCDHTRAEFATVHIESLTEKARLAQLRMDAHRARFGIEYDDVMVFPQGRFSIEALAALRACGYLAAVNTTLRPLNLSGDLVLRNLLEAAITRFADFPLFVRHYPDSLGEFAFDLFLGRPALAVEHHRYFRDGGQRFETFVEAINALDQRLQWHSLATICSRTCLTRVDDAGDVHVRFYTARFELENLGPEPRRFVLYRPQTGPDELPALFVGGRPADCELADGFLRFTVSLDGGQATAVSVVEPACAARPRDLWAARRPTEFLRRLLCEFRDNHVDTHPFLDGLLSGVRNRRWRTKAGDRMRQGSG